MFIRTRKTTKLIKGVNKEKSEKPSILISPFALTCLGLCYYIVGYPRLHNGKNAQNGSVFLIMLSILPLVVGTYLFFHKHFFSLSIF